jgi:LysM repeat protein
MKRGMSLRAQQFSSAGTWKHVPARAMWTGLVFTLVASLGACSSKKSDQDNVGASDTAAVGSTDQDSQNNSDGLSISSVKNSPRGGSWSGHSGPVQMKEQPFQSEGRWMNAYYFIRSPDENWESLSEMIYGRTDRANLIAQWNNQGTLKVGRVVYYNSAMRPDDSTSMKIFAEDFGASLEQITVQPGDTLSLIAKARFGNLSNWKEISSLNNLSNPDLIQIGQTLVVQPVQVNTKDALAQIISQSPPAATVSSASSDSASPPSALAAGTTDSSADRDSPSAETLASDAELADLNPSSVPDPIQKTGMFKMANSDLFMKVGLGIILLALIGFAIRKRLLARKAASQSLTESWDDGANVTKLTRPKTGF